VFFDSSIRRIADAKIAWRKLGKGFIVVDRDAVGRFIEGHQVSVGNKGGRPPRRIEEHLLTTMAEALQAGDAIEEGLRKIAEGIRRGDLDYWKFAMGYLVGTPVARAVVGVENTRLMELLASLRTVEDA